MSFHMKSFSAISLKCWNSSVAYSDAVFILIYYEFVLSLEGGGGIYSGSELYPPSIPIILACTHQYLGVASPSRMRASFLIIITLNSP